MFTAFTRPENIIFLNIFLSKNNDKVHTTSVANFYSNFTAYLIFWEIFFKLNERKLWNMYVN